MKNDYGRGTTLEFGSQWSKVGPTRQGSQSSWAPINSTHLTLRPLHLITASVQYYSLANHSTRTKIQSFVEAFHQTQCRNAPSGLLVDLCWLLLLTLRVCIAIYSYSPIWSFSLDLENTWFSKVGFILFLIKLDLRIIGLLYPVTNFSRTTLSALYSDLLTVLQCWTSTWFFSGTEASARRNW